jgi:4-hydroxy-tetrahydrodipicolinate synthase
MQALIGTGVALWPHLKKTFCRHRSIKRIVHFSIDGGIEYLVVLVQRLKMQHYPKMRKEIVIKTVIEANNGSLPLVLGVGGIIP